MFWSVADGTADVNAVGPGGGCVTRTSPADGSSADAEDAAATSEGGGEAPSMVYPTTLPNSKESTKGPDRQRPGPGPQAESQHLN